MQYQKAEDLKLMNLNGLLMKVKMYLLKLV